jgi:hypothetical protein
MAKIKEKGVEVYDRTLEFATDFREDFKAASGFFQMKIILAALYAGVVAVTILFAPPPPPEWTVNLESVSWGLHNRTAVKVKNLELGGLERVSIEVTGYTIDFNDEKKSGKWRAFRDSFAEGEELELWPEHFVDEKSVPANDSLVVSQIDVYEGNDHLFTFTPKEEKKKKKRRR